MKPGHRIHARLIQAATPMMVDDGRPMLLPLLEAGPQQAEDLQLIRSGKACTYCLYVMPERPCAATLPVFEPISQWAFPRDDHTSRELIRAECCPICAAPIIPGLNQAELEDIWSREAVDRIIAKAEKDQVDEVASHTPGGVTIPEAIPEESA